MVDTRASQPHPEAALWALHFWASLLVLPILSLLALTGSAYLFEREIEDVLDPATRFVAPVAEPMQTSALIAAALAHHPGTTTRVETPEASDRPVRVFITTAEGAARMVVLDPADGRVVATFDPGWMIGALAKRLHGSLMLGSAGRFAVELAACWTLVMLITGLFLWLGKRRRQGRGWLPDFRAGGRAWWRDVHAGAGLGFGLLMGFLVLTGLPWAMVEGDVVRKAVTVARIGYAGADAPPSSSAPHDHHGELASWTMQGQPIPASDDPHATHRSPAPAASTGTLPSGEVIDSIISQARSRGIAPGFALSLPSGPTGAVVVDVYPARPEDQRVMYFDRYSEALIKDVGYQQYGWGARAVETGVQLHMGRYFGWPNQYLMLLACLAVIAMAVSGIVMWAQRRGNRRLAAPPLRLRGLSIGVVATFALLACVLPVFGASIVAVLVAQRVVAWRRQTLPEAT
ncbi:PepSY domain-containing protein [Porphyrobacter sp. TH134]|uniref:PepSY-associated TM helix domain-containing protein n=1 Tax=Porphyrobacter sp. TH134 TaxID=2067450 RepID=UPI000C7B2BC1|nr:PepSY domain-containing protein [Porphyrobacter sp. TH134]PLK23445.1 PepSY domain-containing protein [Porphyrobacter sp. TH134]